MKGKALLSIFLLGAVLAMSCGCQGLEKAAGDRKLGSAGEAADFGNLEGLEEKDKEDLKGEEKQETEKEAEEKEKKKDSKEEEDEGIEADEDLEEESQSVTIAFTGDVLFSDGVLANYDKSGLDGILDSTLIEELNKADITVINNEFPFSDRGTAAEDKQFTFRVSPKRAAILKEMGVDVASLANNHSLDFGVDAMLDTVDTLKEAGILPLGAGKNKEAAKEIAYLEKKGITFAFLGASRVIPVPEWTAGDKSAGLLTTYDPALLVEQIEEAKKQADLVIVYVHWGLERENYPEDYQRSLGQMYIDAGADLVVGSHSHCLQGIEYYKETPIIYSLGNFVFGSAIQSTALLKAVFNQEGELSLSVIPCKGENFRTQVITEEKELEEFYRFYEEISYGVTFEMGLIAEGKAKK